MLPHIKQILQHDSRNPTLCVTVDHNMLLMLSSFYLPAVLAVPLEYWGGGSVTGSSPRLLVCGADTVYRFTQCIEIKSTVEKRKMIL